MTGTVRHDALRSAPVTLLVEVAAWGGWTVLRVHGEVDMATGPQLRKAVVDQIGGGRNHLIVDLADVSFIDSTGLGVLIGGLKRARSQGGDLKVAGIDDRLERIFELTGLGDVLAVIDLDAPQHAEVSGLP